MILRKKSFNGLLATVDLYLDGQLTGTINNGQQQELNLETGHHLIKVQQQGKSGACTVEVKAGEVVHLSFRPSATPLFSFFSTLVAIALLFIFKPVYYVTVGLILPGVIASIYSLTLGREKYYVFRFDDESNERES